MAHHHGQRQIVTTGRTLIMRCQNRRVSWNNANKYKSNVWNMQEKLIESDRELSIQWQTVQLAWTHSHLDIQMPKTNWVDRSSDLQLHRKHSGAGSIAGADLIIALASVKPFSQYWKCVCSKVTECSESTNYSADTGFIGIGWINQMFFLDM